MLLLWATMGVTVALILTGTALHLICTAPRVPDNDDIDLDGL